MLAGKTATEVDIVQVFGLWKETGAPRGNPHQDGESKQIPQERIHCETTTMNTALP